MKRLKFRSLIALGAFLTAGAAVFAVQTAEAERLEDTKQVQSSPDLQVERAPAGIAPPPAATGDVKPDKTAEPLQPADRGKDRKAENAPLKPPSPTEKAEEKAAVPMPEPVPLAGEDRPVRVVPIHKGVTEVPAPPVEDKPVVVQRKPVPSDSIAKREALNIQLDLATVIRVPKETSTIVVGNPIIADTTVQNSGLLVITGKSHGTTNIMALNSTGDLIKEMMVTVVGSTSASALTVQRGMDRETWACSPHCQRTITLGDSNGYFGDFSSQITSRNGLSQGVATQGNSAQ